MLPPSSSSSSPALSSTTTSSSSSAAAATASSSTSAQTASALSSFTYAIDSPESQKSYLLWLKQFFNFHGLSGSLEEQAAAFLQKAKDNGANHHHQWTQDAIISFINYQKQRVQRKEIAGGTLNNNYYAIKLFYEMNDLDAAINWKRVSRGLPKTKLTANDRAPTMEEIRTLVEYPDRRIKALVYTMCASGIRLRSWQYLKWKHVEPIKNDKDEVIVGKLTVYAGEPEEYYTFITTEAYNALKGWIDFRASHGEKIHGDSWVMRDLWQMSDVKYGAKWGLATNPKRLQNDGIKKILNRALRVQGLHQPLTEGKRRLEWKTSHGFRKFFKTRAEQVMKPLNVELLMGHDFGISDSYYRPTEKEVLDDYLKAIDLLTINDHKAALQKQVAELTEKSKEELYILKGQLAESQKEAEQARKALAEFENKQMQFKKEVENSQKKFEQEFIERMEDEREAYFERLQHEILRLNKPDLKKIKDPKKRANEELALLVNADVLDEYDIE